MKRHSPEYSLRIIGGNWRSRKISFPEREGIRPTPDRVRETLFNWLAADIAGAHCLELYAGSGVLSMEALSRGASHVTLVEKDRQSWARLNENLARLSGDPASYLCINDTALHWIAGNHEAFDIVFLDPPFHDNELQPAIEALLERKALTSHGLIYLETPQEMTQAQLPAALAIVRHGRAGRVHFSLAAMRR